jgi:hypothetical protein
LHPANDGNDCAVLTFYSHPVLAGNPTDSQQNRSISKPTRLKTDAAYRYDLMTYSAESSTDPVKPFNDYAAYIKKALTDQFPSIFRIFSSSLRTRSLSFGISMISA